MTFAEFSEVFAVLALQLRCTDADESMARAYFRSLEHLEVATVRLAAERFASTPSSEHVWFPDTAQWIAMVGQIRHERATALKAALKRLPTALCPSCDDTGMAPGADGRYRRCVCQDQRDREIAGLRPLPALPPAPPDDVAAGAKLESMAKLLSLRKAMR